MQALSHDSTPKGESGCSELQRKSVTVQKSGTPTLYRCVVCILMQFMQALSHDLNQKTQKTAQQSGFFTIQPYVPWLFP